MTVEVATYINTLDPTLPTGSDPIPEGDNHLRLIKSAIKTTFPNVAGAISADHVSLSSVGVTQSPGDSSTKVASTAFVQAAIFAASITPANAAPDFLLINSGVI
jgi:hypothetical protein